MAFLTTNIYPSLSVSNFELSLAFYEKVLAELGFSRCNINEAQGIREAEYCFDEYSKVLSIIEVPGFLNGANQPFTSKSSFSAKSQSAVDAFYTIAVVNGATEIEQPSFREDKYSASVLDLDGHQIEACWHH